MSCVCKTDAYFSYLDKQAILETLVFAEVQQKVEPDLPVIVIKGMDRMVLDGFACTLPDGPYHCS